MPKEHFITPAYISRETAVQDSYEEHMARRKLRELKLGAKTCDLCIKSQTDASRIQIDERENYSLSKLLQNDIGLFDNDFPYRFVAGGRVKSHHILMPLGHTALARDLPADARRTWHDANDELEASPLYDYSFYQSPHGPRVSVSDHLHKHFIEFDPDEVLDRINYKRGIKADVRFIARNSTP